LSLLVSKGKQKMNNNNNLRPLVGLVIGIFGLIIAGQPLIATISLPTELQGGAFGLGQLFQTIIGIVLVVAGGYVALSDSGTGNGGGE
jgi:hypothetical protein